jgi:tape measure domain-containing protein
MARRVIGTAIVNVKANTAGFNSELNNLGAGLRGKFGKITGLIAGLGLGHLAKEAIEFGATYRVQLDNASAAIHGLVTNTADANKLIGEMRTMAINTPFDLPGIQNATTRLLAYGDSFGVTSDNVLDWVNTIGDAAASVGKGPDAMLNVITVMGKIAGQGRIMTRDMNQLTANFPSLHPWELLSEMTGKTEQELRKLATKPGGLSGIVDATEFIDQLKVKMEQMPGAIGAMDRRMATLGGTFEYFKDAVGVAMADSLQPFFTTLQETMRSDALKNGIPDLASAFGDLASSVLKSLAPALPGLIAGFGGIIKALIPLAPAVGAIGLLFGNLMQVLAPVIALLASVIGWVGQLLAKLDPSLLKVIATALAALWIIGFGPISFVVIAIAALAGIIAYNWDAIVAATQVMTDAVVAAWDWLFENVIDPVRDFVNDVIGFFEDLYNTLVGNSIIPDLVHAIMRWFGILADFIKAIFTAIKTVAVTIWNAIKTAITVVVTAIATVIKLYFNLYKLIITTYINAIKFVVVAVFNGIRTFLSAVWSSIRATATWVWNAIKTAIISPIQSALSTARSVVGSIAGAVRSAWSGLAGTVSGIWNGIKNAITSPIQTAYNVVSGIVSRIRGLVDGAIRAVHSIPGAGVIGRGLSAIGGLFHHAEGGVFDRPHLGLVAEAGPEAIIPMRNPLRAMQVMHQAGLDKLAASMAGHQRFTGPLVSMPNATIQDATDADLVAQRTLVAFTAQMVA